MKITNYKSLSLILFLGLEYAVPLAAYGQALPSTQVAFLSDIHLQDVYADLKSTEFKGVLNSKNGKYATIRMMEAQLNSTRLFNENYFALYAALNELVKKEIKLVALPGDFTDDGQVMNVKKLRQILDSYAIEHQMRFFITTGNHDPVSPYKSVGGKNDFLGLDGNRQAIWSEIPTDLELEGPIAISAQIAHWGYEEITHELKDYGFFPSEKDLFWSHPFLKLDYEGYSFAKVRELAELDYRTFPIDGGKLVIPDASYLVEPVEGLWLMAIDGNVYLPNSKSGYYTSSSTGFNLAIDQKNHQLDWIKKISAEAKRLNKTLISFSHYPLVDFNDGATEELKSLFGSSKFQLNRVPNKEISEAYLAAGLSVHFAGHMHSNDTGVFEDSLGNRLINIQVPSLAAFPPAYKILSFPSEDVIKIETEILDSVPRMDEFFDLYQMEWNYSATTKKETWNQKVLASKNYLEYTEFHLNELIRLRFLNADWPEPIKSTLLDWNLQDWTYWAGLDSEKLSDQFLTKPVIDSLQIRKIQDQFNLDLKTWDLLSKVPGETIMSDFYQLKNGGELAINSQNELRYSLYSKVFQGVSANKKSSKSSLQKQLILFAQIFHKIQNGLPSDDFFIDLKNNKLIMIEK
jgi:3',5'-cyclic AMP phosphodiesterase CpdA